MHGKSISAKRMRTIRSDYLELFPGWKAIGSSGMARLERPSLRLITFETLSFGAYRPTCCIQVLIAPQEVLGQAELLQTLKTSKGAPGLSVPDRRHEAELPLIAARIKAEFVPSPLQAADATAITRIYESSATPTAAEALSLAALNAYMGNSLKANSWLAKFERVAGERAADGLPEVPGRILFSRALREAIKAGSSSSFLESVWRDNHSRLKLQCLE
ncbi:MAG: hypothetical protein AAB074_08130 [Planctomycetota bacterium]